MISRVIKIIMNHYDYQHIKWQCNNKNFSQLAPHHGVKTASIDMEQRNYVIVTLGIKRQSEPEYYILMQPQINAALTKLSLKFFWLLISSLIFPRHIFWHFHIFHTSGHPGWKLQLDKTIRLKSSIIMVYLHRSRQEANSNCILIIGVPWKVLAYGNNTRNNSTVKVICYQLNVTTK